MSVNGAARRCVPAMRKIAVSPRLMVTTGAVDAAAAVARAGVPAIVFDCESGAQRLGLATALAEAMGAAHVHADDLQPGRITAMIRAYGR